jgi:hypothetical protein
VNITLAALPTSGTARQHEAARHQPEGRPAEPARGRRRAQGLDGHVGQEAADEERRPHEHVEHAVQREAVIVGLHGRRERRVHVDARVLERLREPGHTPPNRATSATAGTPR